MTRSANPVYAEIISHSMIAEFDWRLLPPLAAAPFVGSFLGLLAVRLPANEAIVLGRSHCRNCGTQLSARDLVPLISALLARGRCRYCGSRIDRTHFLVEAAAIAVAIWSILALQGYLAWIGCALGWSLIALAACDIRGGVLPHRLSIPLIVSGVVLAALDSWAQGGHAIVGALVGYAAFTLTAAAYRALRGRDGLGGGDAVLLAAAGSWVGWHGLPSVVLIASVAGLVEALARRLAGTELRSDTRIAFGPHLALGFWLVWLYGPLTLA